MPLKLLNRMNAQNLADMGLFLMRSTCPRHTPPVGENKTTQSVSLAQTLTRQSTYVRFDFKSENKT
eukprot:3698049-Amphidinium_carterae.1